MSAYRGRVPRPDHEEIPDFQEGTPRERALGSMIMVVLCLATFAPVGVEDLPLAAIFAVGVALLTTALAFTHRWLTRWNEERRVRKIAEALAAMDAEEREARARARVACEDDAEGEPHRGSIGEATRSGWM